MTKNETWEVKGEEVVSKLKEIIHEGNARKVTIKDKSGEVLISFPLTVGVVGTMIAPVLAAVGALAALISECSLVIERR